MLHVACSDCVGGGGDDGGGDNNDDGSSSDSSDYKCSSCTDLVASAVYVQSSYLDTLYSNTKLACPYKKYGCASSFAFRDAAAHAAACVYAPCVCPECSFEGSPADLVRHLTEESGRHAWTVHKITYGKEHRYVFDELNLMENCQIFLVAEEDDGVFLLEMDRVGLSHYVALSCVRDKAAAGPVYSSSVAVEGPPAKGLKVKVERKVLASCLTPAKLKYENYELLPVHPELLHGEQTKKIHLCVRISKTQSISA